MTPILLMASLASAKSTVTFQTADGLPAKIGLVTQRITTSEGTGVATDDLCVTPCTVDLDPGLYTFTASRSSYFEYSAAVEVMEGEAVITIPQANGPKVVPTFAGLICCFPVGIVMWVKAIKDEPPLIEGDAKLAVY